MRIHDDEEDRDDAPPLPERAVLDAWTVPEPASELADRVLEHVEAALPPSRQGAGNTMSMDERRRGGFGWALIGVAMVAAAALVLGLVQLWRAEPMQPAAVAAPVVVTVPVPVPIPPASPPTTAPPTTPPPVPADEATPERVDPPDLEDPFAREPSAKEPQAPAPSSKEPDAGKDLMDPFEPKRKAKENAPKDVTLRIGTQRGYGPAQVYIDGKKIGMTPLMNIEVTAGRHTVKWVWADGESAQVSIVVEAGETRTLKGPLSDLKDPYAER